MYSVSFKKSALKEYDKLPVTIQKKVLDIIEVLKINPQNSLLDSKKLKGFDHIYRLRFGDYRLIYSIEKKEVKIQVIKIGHRKDVYEKF